MKLIPGTLIERYLIEEEIGRGGMARVYRVRHESLDTLHALKVLTVAGENLRERLLREGRLQAQLDHPNIVPVRDVIALEQGQGLLMDYIEGSSMDHWLLKERPEPEECERIFLEIVDGVGFAHTKGVVHRDLKPGNVMMEHKHGRWTPRVADFGLAKLVAPEEGEGPLQSRTGRPMGTPAYMAPEQVRSAKHVDHRADVFALGCILYELMCGRRAFMGTDSLEVFNRVTQGQYIPPRQAAEGLEPRIEQAITGSLAIHPDDRIPDCATLAAVLRGDRGWAMPDAVDATFVGGDLNLSLAEAPARPGVPPSEDGTGTLDSVALRSPMTAPTAGPSAAVAAVAPSVPTAVPEPESEFSIAPQKGAAAPATAPTESPPERSNLGAFAGIGALLVVVLLVGMWVLQSPPSTTPALTVTAPAAPPAPTPPPAEPEEPEPEPEQEAQLPDPAPPTTTPEAAPAPPPPPPPPKAAPKPPPAPAGPPAHLGRVHVTGDARLVQLRSSNGGSAEAGDVAPGSYVIVAAFDAGPPMHAGNLVVHGGKTVTLACRSQTLSCSPTE